MRSRQIVSALLLLALAGAAQAQRSGASSGLTSEMRALYWRLFGDSTQTRTAGDLQQEAREQVASTDLDGGGLSPRDIELARGIDVSSRSADRIRQYFHSDLNRDGLLTLDEYRANLRRSDVQRFYSAYETARQAGEAPPSEVTESTTRDSIILATYHAIDADRDGSLSLLEVFRYDDRVMYRPAVRPVEAERFLVLDRDGDGNVTMAEVDATSAAFLAEQAMAGVGPLAEGAIKPDRGRPQLADAVRCRVPNPSAGARIVRLGTREGGQLSAVALGGQDEPTYAITLDIEPGEAPLYIVATSDYPTLWRLTGVTRRVEAFVGSSRARDGRSMWPAVGVTGLARGRVHSAPYGCFGDVDERAMVSGLAATEAPQLMLRRLGRSIDAFFGAYQPQGIRLPSATAFQVAPEIPPFFRTLRNENAARHWQEFLGDFRGGIVSPDPRQIVSPGPTERYEVQSYMAGLAQLLEEGAITPLSNAMENYEIRRQFRYPAGLNGGHSASFRLPDGIPPPVGHPGHSRVVLARDPHICLTNCP